MCFFAQTIAAPHQGCEIVLFHFRNMTALGDWQIHDMAFLHIHKMLQNARPSSEEAVRPVESTPRLLPYMCRDIKKVV